MASGHPLMSACQLLGATNESAVAVRLIFEAVRAGGKTFLEPAQPP